MAKEFAREFYNSMRWRKCAKPLHVPSSISVRCATTGLLLAKVQRSSVLLCIIKFRLHRRI